MNRFSQKSMAALWAAMLLSALLLGALMTGSVGAQDATPEPQVSVEAPSANAEVQVESAEQAEVLIVNGVSVLSTDADIDESGWIQCRQIGGSQGTCQVRVDKKLGRLGFAPVDWSDPDGAVQYMSGLYYENKPDKNVISFCTREMSARWSEGACWVHPSPTATTAPTETPEPTATATATTPATPTATATGTQLPTATATNTPVPTATAFPTATATSTAMPTATVTPTRGDPWRGHTLALGSFCAPGADNPIGQAPGEPIDAHLKVQVGSSDETQSNLWEADNGPMGWTELTELHYGEQPRVWSYETDVTQALLAWVFIDPTSGEIAQVAPSPAQGFLMGGDRDDKRLASLHDCVQPSVPTGTPPPAPAGEQSAALRRNGGGEGVSLWIVLIGFLAFIKICLLCIWIQERIDARKRAKLAETEEGR